MKRLTKFSFLLLTVSLAFSCVYDNEEDLIEKATACDSCTVAEICDYELLDTISFKTHILPIFEKNCFRCHSQENAPKFGSNNAIYDHSSIVSYLNNGLIMPQIKHESGATPMPYDDDKIDTCSIMTIEAWIDQGKLDN